MQQVIAKQGDQLKFSCYDSSGALENTSLSSSFWGLIKLQMIDRDSSSIAPGSSHRGTQ